MDKTCTVCMILFLTVLLAACGRGSNQEAASEKPVDIVSEVAEDVSSETETTAMDETVQKNYKVLLDGTSDQEAVYYLMDRQRFTGTDCRQRGHECLFMQSGSSDNHWCNGH